MPAVVVSEDALLHLPPQFFFRLLDPVAVGTLVQKCIRDGVVTGSSVMAKVDDEEEEELDADEAAERAAEAMASRIVGLLTTEKRAVIPRTDMGIKLSVAVYDKTYQRALDILTERKRIAWPEQGSMRLLGMGAKREAAKPKPAAPAPKGTEPRKARGTAVDFELVRGALTAAPQSVAQIAKHLGAPPKPVKHALDCLVRDGFAATEGAGRGTKYVTHPAHLPKANGAAKQPSLFAEAQA